MAKNAVAGEAVEATAEQKRLTITVSLDQQTFDIITAKAKEDERTAAAWTARFLRKWLLVTPPVEG